MTKTLNNPILIGKYFICFVDQNGGSPFTGRVLIDGKYIEGCFIKLPFCAKKYAKGIIFGRHT